MSILDCESISSTYMSLEAIGIPSKELNDFLLNFDMDNYYDKYNYHDTGDSLLLDIIKTKFKPVINFEYTYWFHLTRTSKSNTFNEGILPLNKNIDNIWNFLFNLLSDELTVKEWNIYRNDLESGNLKKEYENIFGSHYRNKIKNSILWGPYAMLIRDSAFKSKEMGNHDYLKVPEIIEDICYPFDKIYNFNLLDRYIKNTKPCIVKFRHSESKLYYLGAVLFYLYIMHHNLKMNIHCNTCFSGKGIKIPHKDILSVEYL